MNWNLYLSLIWMRCLKHASSYIIFHRRNCTTVVEKKNIYLYWQVCYVDRVSLGVAEWAEAIREGYLPHNPNLSPTYIASYLRCQLLNVNNYLKWEITSDFNIQILYCNLPEEIYTMRAIQLSEYVKVHTLIHHSLTYLVEHLLILDAYRAPSTSK
jgi:hypothetical protein